MKQYNTHDESCPSAVLDGRLRNSRGGPRCRWGCKLLLRRLLLGAAMAATWRTLTQMGFVGRRLDSLVQADFVDLGDYSNFAESMYRKLVARSLRPGIVFLIHKLGCNSRASATVDELGRLRPLQILPKKMLTLCPRDCDNPTKNAKCYRWMGKNRLTF